MVVVKVGVVNVGCGYTSGSIDDDVVFHILGC